MDLLCKISRTLIWIIPCAHCTNMDLVERHTMTCNGPWQAEHKPTPETAGEQDSKWHQTAARGSELQQWGEITEGWVNCSRFSWLQNKITCSGRLGTRHQLWDTAQSCVQATADSLCFAWLKHGLIPNSLFAGTCQGHTWHKSHRNTQAELTGPQMDKSEIKIVITVLYPWPPAVLRAELVQQKPATSCDPGAVLRTPGQPCGPAPSLECCCPLWLLHIWTSSDPQLFLYGKFWLDCTKTDDRSRIQRTWLIQYKSYTHRILGKKFSIYCKTGLIITLDDKSCATPMWTAGKRPVTIRLDLAG